jgi:hypothetical protein
MRLRPLLFVLLALPALSACTDPVDPAPTPVGPIVVTTGGDRSNDPRRVDIDQDALTSPVPTARRERPLWGPPPSATLRAPADPRIEEVDSRTGLPPLPR